MPQQAFIENEHIRVGVKLSYGAVVNSLVDKATGVEFLGNTIEGTVNGHAGQESRLMVDSCWGDPAGNLTDWQYWEYNPMQSGAGAVGPDGQQLRGLILEYDNDGSAIYAKVRPPQYDNWFGYDPEMVMEMWLTLDESTLIYRHKVTYSGIDRSGPSEFTSSWSQECPNISWASKGRFTKFVSYVGYNPWVMDALPPLDSVHTVATVITGVNNDERQVPSFAVPNPDPYPSNSSWPPLPIVPATENWCAIVDNDGWGVGMYAPSVDRLSACKFASYDTQTNDNDWSPDISLSCGIHHSWKPDTPILEYQSYFTVGAVSDIRSKVYQIHAGLPANGAPRNVTAAKRTMNSFTLSYSDVPDAVAYHIYRNGVRWPNSSTEFTDTSVNVSGVTSGDTWRVAAFLNYGSEGALSNPVVVNLPTPLHHVAKGGGSHHFSKGGNHHLE